MNDLESIISPETDVNMHAEILSNFIYDHALKTFGKKIPVKTENETTHSQGPTWFNTECHHAKQDFKTARNTFNQNKTAENRIAFVRMRTKYNKVRKKAKTAFKISEGQRLEHIAKSQPRKFWKSLKKCYNKPKTNKNDVKIEDLYEHFNTLLGQ